MTVSTTLSRISYNGNGATLAFAFPYYFLLATDLQVYVGGTLLTLTTDYTVSGAGSPSGGTVTFVVAPPAATGNVVILRDPDLLQQTDYPPNDRFPAESHERALDKLTMIVQRLRDLVSRSFRFADSYSGNASAVLPNPSANSLVGWNQTADALQNVDPTTLATIVAFGTANGDLFSGTGAQTAFTLSANPGAMNNLDVSIGGVTQRPVIDYNWTSGTTLTFAVAPVAGTNNILVRYQQGLPFQDSALRADLANPAAGFGADQVANADRSFDSVASLLAFPKPNLPAGRTLVVTTIAYYAGGSQGGRSFRWQANSNQAANGGTILNPTGNVGAGRWIMVDQNKVGFYEFGARGNGTDDLAFLNAAFTWATQGNELFGPAGTFEISAAITPPALPFTLNGVPSTTYQDFAGDIGQRYPTYNGTACIIQLLPGAHGALLNSGNHSVNNVVWRCGQARTVADRFLSNRALLSDYTGNKFENLEIVFGEDMANAFAPQFAHKNRFFFCNKIAAGVLVDGIFTQNVFTSCGSCFPTSPGSGYYSIVGNRFEFCSQALTNVGGRAGLFANNLVDRCGLAAVRMISATGMALTGNQFWRNGFNGGSGGRSTLHFTGACRGVTLSGNMFEFGEQDGGGLPSPQYVVELESAGGSAIKWSANTTLGGYTVGMFIDTNNNSQNTIDADRFDLTPGLLNPNTASDGIGNFISAINSVCMAGTYPKLYIYEPRKVNSFGVDASKLFLISGTGASLNIDLNAGSLFCDKLQNIFMGQLYTEKDGGTYAAAAPNGFPQFGSFNNGKRIYFDAPTAGGFIGAVKTAAGSPDVWKTFGAISA